MDRVKRADGGSVYTCDFCGTVADVQGRPGFMPRGWVLLQAGHDGPEFLCGAEECQSQADEYRERINRGHGMYCE